MEAEIRSRLAAGQYRPAFELLLDCFQDKVFRLCCALLRNEGLAEDTAQDVFLRAYHEGRRSAPPRVVQARLQFPT